MANPTIYLSPERRQEPHGRYWGYDLYEHDYCTRLAELVADKAIQQGFRPILADPAKTIYQRTAAYGDADFYLPIHTNASTNGEREGTATGCEVFYKDDPRCKAAAQMMYNRLTALYPSKRGIKRSDFHESLSSDYGCYIEVAFHDNGNDARFLVENIDAIAEAIVRGLCDIFDMPYTVDDELERLRMEVADWKKAYTELEASVQALRTRIADAVEIFDKGGE